MRLWSPVAACAASVALIGMAGPVAGAAATPGTAQARASAVAAAVPGAWGPVQPLPGLTTGGGLAEVSTVSCPPGGPGQCVISGSVVGSNEQDGTFLSSQRDNGTWGAPQFLAASPTVPSPTGISAVTCTSAGNCVAVGTYTTATQASQVFVMVEQGGTWNPATPLPGLAALDVSGFPGVNDLTCVSAGNCVVVGEYSDSSSASYPFVAEEAGGTWNPAIEVPGFQRLAPAGGQASTVSCPSAGNCAVGGYYTAGSGSSAAAQAFVETEASGKWQDAEQVPGTTAPAGGEAAISQVSCPSAGNCVALGSSDNSAGSGYSFLLTLATGKWSVPVKVTSALSLSGISCPATGDCVAVGAEGTPAKQVAASLTEVQGTWGKPSELPGATGLPEATGSEATAISCASAGNCTLVGGYDWYHGVGYAANAPFVADEAGGRWGSVQLLPGMAALNVGVFAPVTAGLSCGAAASCTTAGYYTGPDGLIQPFAATETPLAGTTTSLSLSAAKVSYGSEQSERASVSVSAKAVSPTGKVTVQAGSAAVCTITLHSGTGSCAVPATKFGAGTATLTASYGGGTGLAPSSSAGKSFTVAKAKSATALTLSAAKVTDGKEQAELLTVKVSPQYSGGPSGKVTVKAGSTSLCVITLAAGKGSCKLTASKLKAGTYHLTASYPGNGDFAASASPAKTLTIMR